MDEGNNIDLTSVFGEGTPVEETVIPAVENTVEPIQEEVVIPEPVEEVQQEEEESTASYFARKLGIENYEAQGETLDDLAQIALNRVNGIQEQYSKYNNPVIERFADHLATGGTIEDFQNSPEQQNYFTAIKLEENNIDQHEQVARIYLKETGLSDKIIDNLINGSKDDGTIFELGADGLAKMQSAEQAYNQQLEESSKAEREARVQQYTNYVTELNQTLASNNFDGFVLSSAELQNLKDYSVPDQSGNVKINEVYENLTTKQQLLLNHALLKISKGEPVNIITGKAKTTSNIGAKIVGKGVTQIAPPSHFMSDLKQQVNNN